MQESDRRTGRAGKFEPTSELLTAALDGMMSHIALLDAEGDILFVNRAWRRFGEENDLSLPDAGVGMNYLAACDVQGPYGDQASEAYHGVLDVLSGRRETFSMEYPCHSPEEQRWFILRGARFRVKFETYAVISHENITARRLAEDAIRAHEHQLERLNAMLSHDLRGPFRRIDSLVDDIRAPGIGSEVVSTSLDLIAKETARARDYLASMLDMSRLSIAPLELAELDLSKLAAEVAAVLDPAGRVRWSIEPGLHARGDIVLLRSLLENLFDNALKFSRTTKEPRVDFGFGSDARGREGFFVRDNGIGFSPEEAVRLFRPFVRLRSAAAFGGTGIGLISAARIIERHSGTMWAEGVPGKGATFWFTLPD